MTHSCFSFCCDGGMLVVASQTGVKLLALDSSAESCSAIRRVAFPQVQHGLDALEGTGAAHNEQPLWQLPVQCLTVAGDMPLVAALLRTSAIALRGDPDEAGRTVHIFDGTTGVQLAELYFRGAVIHSLLGNGRVLCVALENGFHLVEWLTLTHLHYEPMTHPFNVSSVLALSPAHATVSGALTYYVAYPHDDPSFKSPSHGVRVLSCACSPQRDRFEHRVVALHKSQVGNIAFSADGALMATASLRGTTIRIVETHSLLTLRTLQRGTLPGGVHALVFNPTSSQFAALSHSGTLHLFSLKEGGKNTRQRASQKKHVQFPAPGSPHWYGSPISKPREPTPWQFGVSFSSDSTHIWVVQASPHNAACFTVVKFVLDDPGTAPAVVVMPFIDNDTACD